MSAPFAPFIATALTVGFLLAQLLMLIALEPVSPLAIVISIGAAGWTVTIPAAPYPVTAALPLDA